MDWASVLLAQFFCKYRCHVKVKRCFGADSGETTRQLLTQTVKHQRSSHIDCTGDVPRNCFRNHSAILVCRLFVCRSLCFLYYFCLFEKIIGEMFGG